MLPKWGSKRKRREDTLGSMAFLVVTRLQLSSIAATMAVKPRASMIVTQTLGFSDLVSFPGFPCLKPRNCLHKRIAKLDEAESKFKSIDKLDELQQRPHG